MDSSKFSRRLRQLAALLATSAVYVLPFVATAPARADTIDQRNEMIAHFVNDMRADPLVADCAAHGSFVASTSTVIDHVDFPPEAFDSAHAEITPWHQPFDEGKQRTTVDNIVTVEGQGIPRETSHEPYPVKFRCGYVGTQMLAFTWNDPVPPLKGHTESTSKNKGKRRHGGHATGHTSKSAVKHSTSKKKKSSAKSTAKH
ncbi:BspC domain-containing protein [Trinickia sp.]|uniref:BspC domain-containing protein n=1 Tax=Trinickia sp. TaxID=2571163 RepID=UPI003F810E07